MTYSGDEDFGDEITSGMLPSDEYLNDIPDEDEPEAFDHDDNRYKWPEDRR